MSAGALELRIAVPDEVGLDEPVPVSAALRNAGDAPAIVNARLLPGRRATYGRELWFEVEGPPGYVNTKRVQVNAGRPGPEHFRRLDPGEEVEKALDLAQYESLHLPGEYAVRAHYENQVQDERLGAAPWVGTIQSERATVRRLGSPRDAPAQSG